MQLGDLKVIYLPVPTITLLEITSVHSLNNLVLPLLNAKYKANVILRQRIKLYFLRRQGGGSGVLRVSCESVSTAAQKPTTISDRLILDTLSSILFSLTLPTLKLHVTSKRKMPSSSPHFLTSPILLKKMLSHCSSYLTVGNQKISHTIWLRGLS